MLLLSLLTEVPMEHSEREKLLRKADSLRKAGRSFWFFGKRLLLIFLFLTLCIGSFAVCARLSGMYILVNEGMALRFEFILQDVSVSDMRAYFTENCLLSDSRLQDMTYADYTVSGYSYSLTFSHMSVWPWQSVIQADVIEKADSIAGVSNADNSSAPPAWTPLKYRIQAVKENGRWKINSVTVLEVNPAEEPAATFDPNVTPLPMVTASPRT